MHPLLSTCLDQEWHTLLLAQESLGIQTTECTMTLCIPDGLFVSFYFSTKLYRCYFNFTTSYWCPQMMLYFSLWSWLPSMSLSASSTAPPFSWNSQCHCHFSFYSSCFDLVNAPTLSWSYSSPPDAVTPKPGVNFGGPLALPQDLGAQRRCN